MVFMRFRVELRGLFLAFGASTGDVVGIIDVAVVVHLFLLFLPFSLIYWLCLLFLSHWCAFWEDRVALLRFFMSELLENILSRIGHSIWTLLHSSTLGAKVG